ncbi:MAG TPA: hypothetical protein QF695_05870 [Arenicellales bacterium]|nr:hypothetical protein [Gammaproteobacteria bacterium]MDP6027943.1 hypothetical protein [Pseudomonadales bacterium]MDP7314660.1 hypothetical protein [Pseudomonadales bacterium]HJL52148.1 hypothetical protein [Arenicellales bacterium]
MMPSSFARSAGSRGSPRYSGIGGVRRMLVAYIGTSSTHIYEAHMSTTPSFDAQAFTKNAPLT